MFDNIWNGKHETWRSLSLCWKRKLLVANILWISKGTNITSRGMNMKSVKCVRKDLHRCLVLWIFAPKNQTSFAENCPNFTWEELAYTPISLLYIMWKCEILPHPNIVKHSLHLWLRFERESSGEVWPGEAQLRPRRVLLIVTWLITHQTFPSSLILTLVPVVSWQPNIAQVNKIYENLFKSEKWEIHFQLSVSSL